MIEEEEKEQENNDYAATEQLTEKKQLPLVIEGKEVYVANLAINDKTSLLASRYFSENNTKKVNQLLREIIRLGEYLGVCIINKFSTSGYLIKISDSFYVVLSLDLKKIVFAGVSLINFHIIESPSNYFVVVNGKEIDISEIELSSHFIKQASERFRVPHDSIKPLFFDIVVNGRYICVTHCKEYHNPAHLFCKDGKLVYVSLDFKVAITTYNNPMNASTTHFNIKEKIENLLLVEIKQLAKKEEKISKRKTKEKLITNLRIAEIELEIFNTKATLKIHELKSELTSLKIYLDNIEDEWNDIVDDIRRHAIMLSAFV